MMDVVDDVLYLKNKQPMDKEYAVILYLYMNGSILNLYLLNIKNKLEIKKTALVILIANNN
jgi:hypothetical protein